MDHLNVTDRFDGAAHWDTLSTDDKAAVGAAALEWVAADHLQNRSYEDSNEFSQRWESIGMASIDACRRAIQDVFVDLIPREALEAPDGAPRIPSLLGMVCRACGCSEHDACPEGCGWAADSLCTACASKGGADAA